MPFLAIPYVGYLISAGFAAIISALWVRAVGNAVKDNYKEILFVSAIAAGTYYIVSRPRKGR